MSNFYITILHKIENYLYIIYEIYYIYKKVRDKNHFSSLTIGKDYDHYGS